MKKRRYVPAVGPRLKRLLAVVFGLFALLVVNSVYLVGVSLMEWIQGQTYQNWFYLIMFMIHLVLGLALILPVILFGIFHMRNAKDRPNRRAIKVGYALFIASLVLLFSGVLLTRIEGVLVIKDQALRSGLYWLHVITPLLAAWLFVLHRLAGKRIKWRIGLRWAAAAAVFAGAMLVLQAQDPREWNVVGPESGEQYFFPSLARTATGDFIPERVLMNDQYCAECHQDSHESWSVSMHRFSSFNNPPYKASVTGTRKMANLRDGNVQASRWCAGCHDPVVFFSGKFDDPKFDDPDFDINSEPTGQAGITCTSCHAITNVNSVRGNADYTIEEPIHYPFAFSENETLQWVNRQLVKAKPEFHKKTFLKPLHQTPEFCSSCHKVHLPPELNDYKWLRGQNHYDAYHLSGVSGHGITSFYYPPKATPSCNECHMPLRESDQFAAQDFDGTGIRKATDHQFVGANTGIPALVGLPDWANERQREFNVGVMRLDLFGLRRGGTIDGPLQAPLRPAVPAIEAGEPYLLDAVVRTVKMGHLFTQGTADSNQVWVDLRVTSGGRVLGRSGGMNPDNEVDPWSHFINIYMLDRDGNRIDRRNAEDIFVPLYNHQIPPGAADVVHYRLEVPEGWTEPVTVEARLQFRKFDSIYMDFVYGEEYINELPILTMAVDTITLPVVGGPEVAEEQTSPIPEWQRWNDYGIGLLRKGGKTKGELAQAEEAFRRVEALGRPDGPLNLARVYLAQGTVQDQAIAALRRAADFDPPAPPWSVSWFTGLVNKQNGYLDEAIADFKGILELDSAETRERGFDFTQDYRLLTELGQTVFERAKQERGESRQARRQELLQEAVGYFQQALELDPENVPAHYNLNLIYRQLGEEELATEHGELYQRYRPDDNARDRAIAIARRNDPAANHAAEAIVIYDLHRSEAYELEGQPADERRAAPYELLALEGAEPIATPPGASTETAAAGPSPPEGEPEKVAELAGGRHGR
ncbi:MAG: multiheme c-type cytochrome [Acidobacteriota bacterium]|nr:multiheme c-type cytochrome [Acidobacteriota bacterium]